MRQHTKTIRSGSQIALGPDPSLELDAKSMGTRSTTLAGKARAKNIGTIKYPGVARRVKNRRRRSSTRAEIKNRAIAKKTLEPTETEMGGTDRDNMLRDSWNTKREKEGFFSAVVHGDPN
jgi:hypothetical protein